MLQYQRNYVYKAQTANPELAAQANALRDALGKYFVSYYPILADITGSPKAALMLGHALQCTRMAILDQKRSNGSFWKTADEWYSETGLTVREIESARKTLRSLGILIEVRQGMPAKLWYTINLNKLSALICKHANITYRDWSWETRLLKALLGKAVITYAPFAWVADSAIAGLYLSRLYNDTRHAVSNNSLTIRRNGETWIKTQMSQGLQDLRIGRKALMNARAKLVDAGVIAELRDARIQSTLISRILFDKISSKIGLEVNKHRSSSEYDKQVCRNTTNNMYPKRVTTNTESAEHEIPLTQNMKYPNRESSSAETVHPIYKDVLYTSKQLQHNLELTLATVQTDVLPVVPTNKPLLLDINNLFFPSKVALRDEKEALVTLLGAKQINDIVLAQKLLDELAGNWQLRPVNNPVGYLRILIEQHLAGTLIFNYAHKIKLEREQRQKVSIERQLAQVLPKSTENQEASQRGAALLERIRKQRSLGIEPH